MPEMRPGLFWWQRVTGEARQHVRFCPVEPHCSDMASLAALRRGCPAGCFEGVYGEYRPVNKKGG